MTDLFTAPVAGKPLPDFACWLDLNGQPGLRPRDFLLLDLAAEADREADHRRSAYPRLVDAMRMTPHERDWGIAVMGAIAADLRAIATPSTEAAFAEDGFAWADKIRALQAEIGMRRRLYPRWIDSGRIDRPIAEAQLAKLEAAHWHYWYHGLRWAAANGAACHWGTVHVDAGSERARNEFRAHTARFTRNTQQEAA